MKQLISLGLVAMLALSCSKDTPVNGTVTMKVSSTSTTGKASSSGRVASTILFSSFKLNISKIKFERSSIDSKYKTADSLYEDTKLIGPFLIEIIGAGNATVNNLISTVSVPNGNFEKVKFKFQKAPIGSEIEGKTYLAIGTIDGKPFKLWSNQELELKVDFSDNSNNIVINGNSALVNIKFRLDGIMSRLTTAFNSGELKLNGSGAFDDISTESNSINKSLADAIKKLFENDCKLDDKD